MALTSGDRLGPYEIVGAIGAGGMGEVYRARDTRLGRDVAIKVLPPLFAHDADRRARFEREARAVASISHPNVVAIHDVGVEGAVTFAVMELLDGETLAARLRRGRLPLRTAVDIAVAIAEGLTAAHARGIVHRDVKPENVFLTGDGRVKLLDFSLARLQAAPDVETQLGTGEAAGTQLGMVLGTIGYMAPEQVRGEPVDARTDVFAFGCLLAEMVTGQRAFVRATPAETFAAILHGEPAGLDAAADVPLPLVRVIRRCLEKRPADRFQSTSDLPFAIRASVDDTRAGAPAAATRRPSRRVWLSIAAGLLAVMLAIWLGFGRSADRPIRGVAVLPFDTRDGDPATEYLGEAFADHIINGLAAVGRTDLRVRPFNSVVRYSGRQVAAATVANDLDVDTVVTGTLRQNGEALAVSVALVDAREDAQLWGKRYERRSSDLLLLQDELARDVAAQLHLRPTAESERRLAVRDTEDPEAYRLYRQGVYETARFSMEHLQAARDYFQRAVVRDPRYVSALAGVARTYLLLGAIHLGPRVTYAELERAIERAREVDPNDPEVRILQGITYLFHDWRWDDAASALDPDRVPGSQMEAKAAAFSMYGFLLGARGQAQAALESIQRANEIEPLSAPRRAELAAAWLWMRDPDRAIAEARRTLELNPRFVLAYHHIGLAQLHKGLFDEAAQTFEQGLRLDPQSALLRGGVGLTHAAAGRQADARATMREIEALSPRVNRAYATARIHAALGEREQALAWLRQSAADRDPHMIWVRLDATFDALRTDPRFDRLVEEIGLPPSPSGATMSRPPSP